MNPLAQTLKVLLEETIDECAMETRRDNDPVGLVHDFQERSDREVVALLASSLAYGRVNSIREAIARALEPLGNRPARFLKSAEPQVLLEVWDQFKYRMTSGLDLVDLGHAISLTLQNEGSLEALYRRGAADALPLRNRSPHFQTASRFVRALRKRRYRNEIERGFRYLLPDPADGSATKRLHLYFRWMIRGPDLVDMGIWTVTKPSALIMPLDTHTSRLCRYLGLLDRKSLDRKAAMQVTRRLSELDADDPLRYDFALCHLGISGKCIHRACPRRCPACPIEKACLVRNQSASLISN